MITIDRKHQLFRMDTPHTTLQPNQKSTRLYLQGLDPAASYEVEGKVFPGDLLMQAGYPMQHVAHDMDARILWLRRVEA